MSGCGCHSEEGSHSHGGCGCGCNETAVELTPQEQLKKLKEYKTMLVEESKNIDKMIAELSKEKKTAKKK